MRKVLAITLAGSLMLAAFPGTALAGDSHAVSNRWAGVAIGAAAAVIGGMLLNAVQTPVVAPPPVAYAPPPVTYVPPVTYAPAPPVIYSAPEVVYAPPPVVYAPARVVVHRDWAPRGHEDRGHRDHGRGWGRR